MTKKPSVGDDISVDELMARALKALYGMLRSIEVDVSTGSPGRETFQNLKDVVGMLKELKREEKEFLSRATDEDLEKILKNDNESSGS